MSELSPQDSYKTSLLQEIGLVQAEIADRHQTYLDRVEGYLAIGVPLPKDLREAAVELNLVPEMQALCIKYELQRTVREFLAGKRDDDADFDPQDNAFDPVPDF